MELPIEELTPAQIVAELDRYIVGQHDAKRAVAVALRNRFRRQQLPLQDRDDIVPKNILMIGPTGVGKTEIARRLAQLARAPFVKVEATKFTEVGYVGRDVDSMIRDLAANAVRLIERERMVQVQDEARERALERIVDQLIQHDPRYTQLFESPEGPALTEGDSTAESGEWIEAREVWPRTEDFEQRVTSVRDALRAEVLAGEHDQKRITVEIQEQGSQFLQVFTPQGMEEMGLDMLGPNSPFGGPRTSYREVTVSEARGVLEEAEAKILLEPSSLNQEAIHRAEQTGIVFIDEIDKVAIKSGGGGGGPDVSREGVQRDLLPVIEGSTVATKFGPLRTDHVLFICAGAFHMAAPSDLIPELQGRLPIRVELQPLAEEDFGRILREPKNAIVKQYQKLLGVDGTEVAFTEAALDEIAHFAVELNTKVENIGARRLHTLMEKLLEPLLFEAPDCGPRKVTFDVEEVRSILGPLVRDSNKGRSLL